MTKVYVVMSGEYSDISVEGVFSTKAKAEKYCQIHEKTDPYSAPFWVNDFELDEDEINPNAEVKTYYEVSIALEDIWNSPHTELWTHKGDFILNEEDNITNDKVFINPVVIEKIKDEIYVSSIYGFEHAKKVAIEQYQMYTQQKLEEEICEADKYSVAVQVSERKREQNDTL